MKLSDLPGTLAAGTLALAPALAAAQASSLSPQSMGRIDILGRFAGDAPFCEPLGCTPTDPDGQAFARELAKLAERVGANPREVEAAVAAAKARETGELQAARDRVLADLKDPGGDPALRAFADTLSVRCRRAVDDPAATVLMKPPTGAVSSISRRYVDSLVAPYNRAGWQTPYVLGSGELAEAVGACEARLGRARTSPYLAPLRDPTAFPPDINDTIQAWLDTRVAKGRETAKTASPSAAQCGQMLTRRKAALTKALY